MKKIILYAGFFILLISCGPSKAELEAREMAKQDSLKQEQEYIQPEKRLTVVSDSSITTFRIKIGDAEYQGGRLMTVKHDGCDFIVWFNQQGQQVMHSPSCNNYLHKR